MKIRIGFLVPALALLASCATPEQRLRAGLEHAGLSPRMAACMAERMVDRLSLLQLHRIGDLPRAREAVTMDEFLYRVRSLRDREILEVSASSAIHCEARHLLG